MSDYNAYLARMEAKGKATLHANTNQSHYAGLFSSFDEMFDHLNYDGSNYVSLYSLRYALGGTRESQDATITVMRASGHYTLTSADRYLSHQTIENAYVDSHGESYHYISKRS